MTLFVTRVSQPKIDHLAAAHGRAAIMRWIDEMLKAYAELSPEESAAFQEWDLLRDPATHGSSDWPGFVAKIGECPWGSARQPGRQRMEEITLSALERGPGESALRDRGDLQSFRVPAITTKFPSVVTAEVMSEKCHVAVRRLLDLAEAGFIPHVRIDDGPPLFAPRETKQWVAENLVTFHDGKPLRNAGVDR